MKKLIYLLMLLVSLVLITSCNLGPVIEEPKVPDDVVQILDKEPNKDSSNTETQNGTTEGKKEDSNCIDKILGKLFKAQGSTIYIDSSSIFSFTISK